MVDWDRVERLRSKGFDWDTIAADPKVSFTPPAGVGDPGRALKTVYYSKKSRGGGTIKSKKTAEGEDRSAGERIKAILIPLGIVFAIAGAIWAVVAFETSLVAVFLPAIEVLLVVVAGLVMLGLGMVAGSVSLQQVWKKSVAVGLVVGLVLAGGLALFGAGLGVCNLNGTTVSEPGGWESESPRNALCPSGSLPVFFYYGSIACPYCSASSWAMDQALLQFGTLTGTQTGTSDPGDAYPNTPEVEFVGSSLASSYISWDPKEGNNDFSTADLPSLSWQEQAYVNTYGGSGIPFVVVGGIFIHSGTMVDPSILQGLSPQQVQNDIQSGTGNVYNAIHQATLYLEAFLVKSDQIAGIAPPSSLTGNTAVMDIVAQIH